MQLNEKRLYTVAENSKLIGISDYTIRKYIRSGELRFTCKRSKWYMISLDNLRDFASRESKYIYIFDILNGYSVCRDNRKIIKPLDSDELSRDSFQAESEKVLRLKIRIKELEIKILKYESKFGPLE